jgi:hypothetical protein
VVQMIYAVGYAARQWTEQQVDDHSVERFGVSPDELSEVEVAQLIDGLRSCPIGIPWSVSPRISSGGWHGNAV